MMKDMIQSKLDSYPDDVSHELQKLKTLILEVAQTEGLNEVEENLKWGQLSYSVPQGSPIRIDWNKKAPDSLSIFFNCQTKLIETFKEIYPDNFEYVGSREMIVPLRNAHQVQGLSHCISLALRYHKIKDLPLLGC